MNRLDRKPFYAELVRLVQRRSTCLRLQVGAVLLREGRMIAVGYNGAPTGIPHCTPDICGPDISCTRTIHAEANCIAFAAKHGIATGETAMWCTDSPCIDCAKLLINAGVAQIIYLREYRDVAPLDYLRSAGVTCKQYLF